MNFRLAPRLKERDLWKLNRMVIGVNGLWVTTILAAREIPHRLTLALDSLRRYMSPRRAVAASVLAALIIAPTILYLVERNHRRAKERAYRALSLSAASETSYLTSSLNALLAERARLTETLLDAGYWIRKNDDIVVKVVATGYSSSVRETDSTPFITASNTRTREGILAMSRDLLQRYTPGAPFDFGDHVHVPGLGEFIVEDSMNSRWNNRIDIWFPSRLDAIRFGIKEVYVKTLDEEQAGPDELSENEPVSSVTGL